MALGAYRGVSCSLVPSADQSGWRWTVALGANADMTGSSCSKGLAVTRVFLAIDLASCEPNFESPRRPRLSSLIDGRSFCGMSSAKRFQIRLF